MPLGTACLGCCLPPVPLVAPQDVTCLAVGLQRLTRSYSLQMEPRRVLIAGDEDAKAAAPAPAPAPAPEPAAPTEANFAAAAAVMDTAPGHGNNGGDPKKNPEARSEEDGSVEDLSDEEREAERAARRRKALAAEAGPVLMDADEAPAVAA